MDEFDINEDFTLYEGEKNVKTTTKLKPEAIDRYVEQLRHNLEHLSDAGSIQIGEPIPVMELYPQNCDLIEEPVFAVGDLVTTVGGTALIIIEVKPGSVRTKPAQASHTDATSYFHP